MDRSAFTREVAALTFGKRMPDSVYTHVEALPQLPGELQAAVGAARALAKVDEGAFDVVKFALSGWKLSLLAYPGFFAEPFPALAASWAVDLDAGTVSRGPTVREAIRRSSTARRPCSLRGTPGPVSSRS